MLTPTVQNLKDLFTIKTGFNPDEKPADFAAFLFLKSQEAVRTAMRKIDRHDRHPQPVSPKLLYDVLSHMLINDYNLHKLTYSEIDSSIKSISE